MTSASENTQREVLFVTDIETTGLDPQQDCIVEIASIAVDARTLEEVGRFHTLASPSGRARFPHPAVLKMKSENGLWAALAEKNVPTQHQAARAFAHFLGDVQPSGKITLAGDSVHFDLGFLRVMDNELLADRLNHRVINISTFRDTFNLWGLPWVTDDKIPGHRAMADAEKSLEKLRYAKRFLEGNR